MIRVRIITGVWLPHSLQQQEVAVYLLALALVAYTMMVSCGVHHGAPALSSARRYLRGAVMHYRNPNLVAFIGIRAAVDGLAHMRPPFRLSLAIPVFNEAEYCPS